MLMADHLTVSRSDIDALHAGHAVFAKFSRRPHASLPGLSKHHQTQKALVQTTHDHKRRQSMATSYAYPDDSRYSASEVLARLHRYVSLKVELLLRPANGDAARAKAIAALESATATPDLRDWAERYLCGLAGQDPAEYLERRKWQS
jgi:hypothetical protein